MYQESKHLNRFIFILVTLCCLRLKTTLPIITIALNFPQYTTLCRIQQIIQYYFTNCCKRQEN